MLIYTLLISSLLMLMTVISPHGFETIDWRSAAVIAFALSFSSTIFAINILEGRGEIKTRHGQITIGILIIQDVIAVLFLTFAMGKIPSPWAIGLLALPLFKPLLGGLLNRTGHGEILVLFGITVAIAGGELFEWVGLKAGLGALVFGVLLSGHVKTAELAKSLLNFKNIFLIGFFLSIGLAGLPSVSDIAIAAMMVFLFLPIKSWLYFGLMIGFKLRGRTGFLSSNDLSNYSEFGLIVASVAVGAGWLDSQWLTIIALALTLSFIAAALFNTQIHRLYAHFEHHFHRLERPIRLVHDQAANLGNASILIVGMGRIGQGVYDIMNQAYPKGVCGIDADSVCVEALQRKGVNALVGDAEDVDFWQGIQVDKLKLIMIRELCIITAFPPLRMNTPFFERHMCIYLRKGAFRPDSMELTPFEAPFPRKEAGLIAFRGL